MNFKVNKKKLLDFLRSILKENTENPPGNERLVAEIIKNYLEPLGFETKLYEPEHNRTSLLAVLKGAGGGRSLVMNGHIDIGPIGNGWTVDPLGGEIKDGKIFGRGTGDMKSGIAAMICASEIVVNSKIKRLGDLYLTCVADESSGGHKGTGYLIKNAYIDADMGIICEPSGGDIGIAHRGVVWMEITIKGKSGQASRPWSGKNSISYMGKVISGIDDKLPKILGSKVHNILPSPTYSFGVISGGIKTNVIAENCTLTIDRRTLPGEKTLDVISEVKEICKNTINNSEVEFNVKPIMVVEPSEVKENSEVVEECRKASRNVLNREPQIGGTGGFTDAHWFNNNLHIPTVIYGPWYLHLNDKKSVSDIPDEYNYVEDIITGTKIYANLIANVIC